MTEPSLLTSLRDTLLVARFELLRARRTWQAMAVILLFAIASGGSTYGFVQLLLEIENNLAAALGVPPTDSPGALTDVLLASDDLRRVMRGLINDWSLIDDVLEWPLVAIFHFWTSLVLVPWLAAFVSADTISEDVRTRAVRFELLRTGRLELVYGRFLGQCLLLAASLFLGGLTSFAVAWWYMILPDPLYVMYGLLAMSLRAFLWGLPFLGLGVACSESVKSATWARILALIGTTFAFIGHGILIWLRTKGYGLFVAPLIAISPASWIRSLWAGGLDTALAGLYLPAFAMVLVGLGYLVLARRDA